MAVFQTIDAKVLAEELGFVNPQYLLTRPNGERFATALRSKIVKLGANSVIELNMSDIKALDVSFPDEVFANIATERAQGKLVGASLFLSRVKPIHCEEIGIVLDSRPRKIKGIGNFVLPMLTAQDGLILVGPCESQVLQTFNFIRKKNECSSSDLIDEFKLSSSAASTRLKLLFDLGLLVRSTADDSSKQLIYKILI